MVKNNWDLKNILAQLHSAEGLTPENDLEIATALSENYDSESTELFQICSHVVLRPEYEGSLTFEVSCILLEEYINPDQYLAVLLNLTKLHLLNQVESPFWHMLARSSYRLSQDFETAVQAILPKNPSFFAEVIERSQRLDFLPLLEKHIQEVIPVVKYLPMTNISHEHLWEHDFWLRGGFAYYRLIKEVSEITQSPKEYLHEKFLQSFPDLETWMSQSSDELIDWLNSRIEIYNNMPEEE